MYLVGLSLSHRCLQAITTECITLNMSWITNQKSPLFSCSLFNMQLIRCLCGFDEKYAGPYSQACAF